MTPVDRRSPQLRTLLSPRSRNWGEPRTLTSPVHTTSWDRGDLNAGSVLTNQSRSLSCQRYMNQSMIHDSYKLLYFESEQEYRFFSKISKKLKTVLVRGWTEYHKSVRQVSTKSPVNILQEYDPLAKNSAVWQTMGGKSQKLVFFNRILTIISKLG